MAFLPSVTLSPFKNLSFYFWGGLKKNDESKINDVSFFPIVAELSGPCRLRVFIQATSVQVVPWYSQRP